MRNFVRTACLSLALLAGAAAAQAQGPSLPIRDNPRLQNPDSIRNATVVERGSLPPQLRVQVDSAVAQASPDDLKQLRQSIDAIPAAAKALQAKGMNSAAIIAVGFDEDGDLTLIAEESI
ncbi:hypothetical protein ASE66_12345 [Bosea sp. Root483D1]|uniref:hypothetical protein n=1 Tax=Bosea sp. Root483D1 TaxID=1736544 RepID=UPI000710DD76|nr:hypothetical protein [Bosea sp. Root483D1]KRE15630.1 hypothetical protein ASE66_12345 [Bosea sp. Root483D1]